MARSQSRQQFMVSDPHSDLLTLEEALGDWPHEDRSRDSRDHGMSLRRSQKSLCLLAASPSTRRSSFELFAYNSHDKVRGESFSSDASFPSMVEDHSGIFDSDADPSAEHDQYEESMSRLWNTYETLLVQNEAAEATMFHRAYLPDCLDDLQFPLPPSTSGEMLPHKPSRTQSRLKSRPSREFQGTQCSSIPVPTRNRSRIEIIPGRSREPNGGLLIPVPNPIPVNEGTGLHRSHAPRTARRAPDTIKSLLPAPPPQREGPSLHSSPSKRSRSRPLICPVSNRHHQAYRCLPYHGRPAMNPCNSSHPYSLNNTPALPFATQTLVEKSVFDYDTDDENTADLLNQPSSSLASKMHIRGLSLGSKLGLTSKKDCNKHGFEGTGRRRSATEVVMTVFGLGKK